MRKSYLVSLAASVMVVLAGCSFFTDLLGKPDVQANDVTVSTDGTTGVLKGVTVTIKNNGPTLNSCGLAVVLVSDLAGAISTASPIVYKGSYDSSLAANSTVTKTLTTSEMPVPAGTTDGQYYFGLIVDPDGKIGDTDAGNNTVAAKSPGIWVVGGQYMAGVVSGTLTIPSGLQWDQNADSVLTSVKNDAYKIYGVMIPNGYVGNAYGSLPGATTISVTYNGGTQSTVNYMLGIPTFGSAYIGALFMDVNGDGTPNMLTTGPLTEPYAFYPDAGGASPPAFTPGASYTGKDITLYNGN